MNTENLLATTESLDPGTSWVAAIGIAFDKMEIGENEIGKAQSRHPERSQTIWDSFKLLCPSAYVREALEPVYRAHCAELLDRVAHGFDTTLGTKAEVMMGLSETSLKSPLPHTAAVLYARIFQGIFPDSLPEDGKKQLAEMAFDGTTGTLLAELSKKCRDPERKLGR